ncbi:MAG: hypothetical protein ACKVWR_10825 [Acidimicrobiales bacterium]
MLGAMARFILASLVASIVLTVVLNAALAASPKARRLLSRPAGAGDGRVFMPWKVMLLVSLALTVLLNLVVR